MFKKLKHLRHHLHTHVAHHLSYWARNVEYTGGVLEVSFVVVMKVFLFAAVFTPQYGEHSFMAQKIDSSLVSLGSWKMIDLQKSIQKEALKTWNTTMKKELYDLVIKRIDRMVTIHTYQTYLKSFEHMVSSMNIVELMSLQLSLWKTPLSTKAPVLYALMQEKIESAQQKNFSLPEVPLYTAQLNNSKTWNDQLFSNESSHASAPIQNISSSQETNSELKDFVQMLWLDLPSDQLDDQ